jgi:hypothetical protein
MPALAGSLLILSIKIFKQKGTKELVKDKIG